MAQSYSVNFQKARNPTLTISHHNERHKNQELIFACQQLEKEAIKILEAEYPVEKFPFHNVEHSKAVADAAEEILRLIQEIDPDLVSDEDIAFARVEAMFHDIPQDREQFENQDYSPNSGLIVRKRGFNPKWIEAEKRPEDAEIGNEQQAAINLFETIKDLPEAELFEQFTEEDVHMDIGTTCPEEYFDHIPDKFLPDHSKGRKIFTMIQKYARSAGIRGLAIALADLKETGGHITNQEIPHQPALEAGNNEFRELFKQITLEIQAMKDDGESITKEEQQRIIKEIIKWKRVQEEFYLGQQFDLEQILEKNPTINKNPESADKLKNAIRGRFKDFSTITHGLRQEYLDLVNKLGFIDESGQPLLDQISALEQRIGELNNEISLMLPNLEKLANQKQILTDQLNELIKQFDEKMATQTEEDFLTAIHAIGY